MGKQDENLISIDEIIEQAKKLGVDFGKGDPRNRLRYYTKIGLLPHAQRKSFNGLPPNGAYSKETIGALFEIDKKIKEGKSIQTIKREIGRKKEITFEKISPVSFPAYPIHIYKPLYEPFKKEKVEIKETLFEAQAVEKEPRFLKKSSLIKIFGICLLIFMMATFVLDNWLNEKKILSYFLASFQSYFKLAQETSPQMPVEEPSELLSEISYQPYLTINAETDINGPLNIKEKVTTPVLVLTKEQSKGSLTVASLSADQNYIFPDQSGTVCLTTGNCVGLGGEVISFGGFPNRLAKFISSTRVGNSSISDFYSGVAITIDALGRVGIGTFTPEYDLHVEGKIQATGDICTDINGKCLSQISEGGIIFLGGGGGGIDGSGSVNYVPLWTGATVLGDSVIYQSGGNIGIDLTSPSAKLDVAGTVKMTGFQLSTNATSGYILTSDSAGVGTWQPIPGGTIPSGSFGQTLYHDGTSWVADSFLYNTGSAIGIGTTSTLATLTVAGDGRLEGPLTITTTTLPQLVLRYNNDNYLNFSLSGSQAEISASSTLIIDSLTGEIRTGGNVNLFNASGTEIRAATFVSDDATARKSGELILCGSVPIFRFSVPAQTTSTNYIRISKYISEPLSSLPSPISGTVRKFAFLINFADDIPTTASSSWRVYRPTAATTSQSFEISGQNLSSLIEGTPYLSNSFTLPDDDWQLEVMIPSNRTIRIFKIFLIVYDEIQ
jgi:hypothetical protein